MNFLNSLMMLGLLAETVPVTSDAWASVITALTAQISVESIVAVLAVLVGAVIGIVFMWWGVRKVVGAIMSAFRKGRVSL